jgi:hypothetical protein
MDTPDFLAFTPVPLRRVRANGWTPYAKRRLVAASGRGASVVETALIVLLKRRAPSDQSTLPKRVGCTKS